MGTSPEDSVVDSHQRSWQQDNLFLAGPGSMPCMGTSNPTLTVAALAFRTAADLVAQPEGAA
jgi:choline dehydrogenase-like flavoprotein